MAPLRRRIGSSRHVNLSNKRPIYGHGHDRFRPISLSGHRGQDVFSLAHAVVRRSDIGVRRHLPIWSSDMLIRPRDLVDRVAERHPLTITLPLEAARRKAREIIDRSPRSGLAAVIEKWRQLPDGRIEFAIRHFQAED
jgi:hypothetical protein